jgi:protein subunit release factor B
VQGRWPESYDRLWELMNEKHGRQDGTRSMIAILRLGREFGYVKLETSVEQALVLGCTDVAAIRHLLMSDELQHAVATTMEIGALAAYERPLPTMAEYNQLLTIEVPA